MATLLLTALPASNLKLRKPLEIDIEIRDGVVIAQLHDVGLILEGHGSNIDEAKAELAEGMIEQFHAAHHGRPTSFTKQLCQALSDVIEET